MVFGGNTSCFQIESPLFSDLLVIDCGTGFRNLGNHLINGVNNIRGRVFITHPHWDHLQGFPFFKPFYEDNCWFRIYLPPQEDVGCKEILQGHMSNTFFPVTIDMLEADMDCETFQPGKINFEGFSVDYMWAKHTVQTAMFKFEIGGNTIIIAPDNELPIDGTEESKLFIEEFREFVRGADLLVHDAQFNFEQHKEREGWGHTNWETLIEETKDLGIKNLILTHHDPDSSDSYLENLNKNIKDDFSGHYGFVGLAKEGQVLNLPIKE